MAAAVNEAAAHDAAELRAQFQPTVQRIFIPRGDWTTTPPFKGLLFISVTHCRLDLLPPLGTVCPQLRELNVSFNRLRVMSPGALRGCGALTTVQLHANELLSLKEVVTALAGVPLLETLTLFDNPCLQEHVALGGSTAAGGSAVLTSQTQRVHSRLGGGDGPPGVTSSTDRWSRLAAEPTAAAGLPPVARYVAAACPRLRQLAIASPFAWAQKRHHQQQQRHDCWREQLPLADDGPGASSTVTGDDVRRACIIAIAPAAAAAAEAWLHADPAGRAFVRLLASMDATVATELARALADAAAYTGVTPATPVRLAPVAPTRRLQKQHGASPAMAAAPAASSAPGGYRVTFSGRILDGATGGGTAVADGLADGAVALRDHGDGCVECAWPEGGPALVVAVDEEATAALRAQASAAPGGPAGTATTTTLRAFSVTACTREQQGELLQPSSPPSVCMDGFGAGAVMLYSPQWCRCGADAADAAVLRFQRDGSWYVCGQVQQPCGFIPSDGTKADAEVAAMLAVAPTTSGHAPGERSTLPLVTTAAEATALLQACALGPLVLSSSSTAGAGAASARGQAGADDDAVAVRCKLVCDAFPTVTSAEAAAAAATASTEAAGFSSVCPRCRRHRPFAFRTPDGCYAWQLGSQLGVTYRGTTSTLRIVLACRALQYELAVFTAADA